MIKNNKGFAITTLVYGLSILGMLLIVIIMGTLSNTRRNIKEQADSVERDLLNYKNTSVIFNKKGTYTYEIPENQGGYYRIEVYGPYYNSRNGMNTTGIIKLVEKTKLSINITDGNNSTKVSILNKNGTTQEIIKSSAGNGDGYSIISYPDSTTAISTDSYGNKLYFINENVIPWSNEIATGKVIIEKIASSDVELNNTYTDDALVNVDKVVFTFKETVNNKCTFYYTTNNQRKSQVSSSKKIEVTGLGGINIDMAVLNCQGITPTGIIGKVTKKTVGEVTIYNNKYGSTTNKSKGIIFSSHQPNPSRQKEKYVQRASNASISYTEYSLPKHGNYYLMPKTAPHRVLAYNNSNQTVVLKHLTGNQNERWSIDLLNNSNNTYKLYDKIISSSNETIGNYQSEYKITELTTNRALDIKDDENRIGNQISAQATFNSLIKNDPQVWNLIPNDDGTYSIKTIVNLPTIDNEHKGCYIAINSAVADNQPGGVVLGSCDENPKEEEKFYLNSIDFSSSVK